MRASVPQKLRRCGSYTERVTAPGANAVRCIALRRPELENQRPLSAFLTGTTLPISRRVKGSGSEGTGYGHLQEKGTVAARHRKGGRPAGSPARSNDWWTFAGIRSWVSDLY